MPDPTRRDILQAGAAWSIAAAAIAPAVAAAGAPPAGTTPQTSELQSAAFAHQHLPVPLPFAAGSLKGLSERLIRSHWENNYGGSVRALNAVRGRLLQALGDSDMPPYLYNGLKREQLFRTGSVVLHELYFANLGGDGKAGADLRTRIAASFGSFDRWESEFRKIGQGLAGGSGWVVLGFNRRLGLLENAIMFDHSTGSLDTTPVLVMDMYEHAFALDHGAAATAYIDAFFANIQWDAVAGRLAA